MSDSAKLVKVFMRGMVALCVSVFGSDASIPQAHNIALALPFLGKVVRIFFPATDSWLPF